MKRSDMGGIKAGKWVLTPRGGIVGAGVWRVVAVDDDIISLHARCHCCPRRPPSVYGVPASEITRVVSMPRAQRDRVAYGGKRSDGYHFTLTKNSHGYQIVAGCRRFTSFAEANAHWRRTRGGTDLGDETFRILRRLRADAKKLGLTLKPARKGST